jgi:uncharacterized protein YegP (UPF0339 family)
MRFVIKKAGRPPYYWFTIVGDNGEIVVASETYRAKQSAIDAIIAIKAGVHPLSTVVDETDD